MASACAVCSCARASSASCAMLDCSASALSALNDVRQPLLGVADGRQPLLARDRARARGRRGRARAHGRARPPARPRRPGAQPRQRSTADHQRLRRRSDRPASQRALMGPSQHGAATRTEPAARIAPVPSNRDPSADVIVHGRVQGVFFRDSPRERAARERRRGWARNRPTGRSRRSSRARRGGRTPGARSASSGRRARSRCGSSSARRGARGAERVRDALSPGPRYRQSAAGSAPGPAHPRPAVPGRRSTCAPRVPRPSSPCSDQPPASNCAAWPRSPPDREYDALGRRAERRGGGGPPRPRSGPPPSSGKPPTPVPNATQRQRAGAELGRPGQGARGRAPDHVGRGRAAEFHRRGVDHPAARQRAGRRLDRLAESDRRALVALAAGSSGRRRGRWRPRRRRRAAAACWLRWRSHRPPGA